MTYIIAYLILAMVSYGTLTIQELWGCRANANKADRATTEKHELVFAPKIGFWLLETATIFLVLEKAFEGDVRLGNICGVTCAAAVTGSLVILVRFHSRRPRKHYTPGDDAPG